MHRVENAEDLKPPKRKRCSVPQTSASIRERETHILLERQQRSDMNQLFSKMHSLLPNQIAKVCHYLHRFFCTDLDHVFLLKKIKYHKYISDFPRNAMNIGCMKIKFQKIKVVENSLCSLLFSLSDQLTNSGQWCDGNFQSDKITIVAETINYIHYLQQRLNTDSKKCVGDVGPQFSSNRPILC